MSDIFALDRKGNEALESQAQQNPLDPNNMRVNSWTGLGRQVKRLMSGSASASRTLGVAAGGVGVLIDKAAALGQDAALTDQERKDREALGLTPRGVGAAEWTFENIAEGVGQSAVDYWTPDAATTGAAASTVGTVFDVLGRVPQMFGATPLFLADAAVAPATDVVRAGGSLNAAGKVGGISLAANTAGMIIPAALGTKFLTRVTTGAAGNVAVGAAQNKVTQEVLERDGLHDLAASYDPLNPQSLLIDTLMGAAFGAKAHVDARAAAAAQAGEAGRANLKQQAIDGIASDRAVDLLPSQRDAILAANNANNFQRRTLPGEPREVLANMQHQAAAELALAQLNAGRKVDVSGVVDLNNFELRPELQPHKAPADWIPRTEIATQIRSAADALGIDAVDLATAISFETGGTFDPKQRGPTTKWGQHVGLIQMGEPQRAKYGYDPNGSSESQMKAIVAYMKDAGVRPGMGMLDVYSAINAGRVGRYNASDTAAGGTRGSVRDKVEQQMADHRKKAEGMFKHGTAENFGLPEMPRTVADNDPLMQAIPEGEHGRETANIDTPERDAMRDQWVEEHFAQAQQRVLGEGERPIAWVMGGGGASGKGTLLRQLKDSGFVPTEGAVHIDPDAIKTGENGLSGIPEYRALITRKDGRGAAIVHEESSQVAKRVLDRAMAGKYDLIMDRTLGDPAQSVKMLESLKAAGYEIRLHGITVDPGEAVVRAVKRANEGEGRFVPLKHLLKAHKGFSQGFESYSKLADSATLYDNSGTSHQRIAVSDGGVMKVLNQTAYNDFRGRRKLNDQATNHRSLEAQDGTRGVGRDSKHHAGTMGEGSGSPGTGGTGERSSQRLETGDRGTGAPQGEVSQAIPVETAVDAAKRVAIEQPDAMILDGFDADGSPRYRPLSEALLDIESERAQAEKDADGYTAAANCFVRRGSDASAMSA